MNYSFFPPLPHPTLSLFFTIKKDNDDEMSHSFCVYQIRLFIIICSIFVYVHLQIIHALNLFTLPTSTPKTDVQVMIAITTGTNSD